MLEQLRQVNGIDPNRVSEFSNAEQRNSLHKTSLSVLGSGGDGLNHS
jgi:hypothetical protein